jgi:hypothetical protein
MESQEAGKPEEIKLPANLREKYDLNGVTSPLLICGRTPEFQKAGIAGAEIDLRTISPKMAEKLAAVEGFTYLTKREKPKKDEEPKDKK